MRLVEKLFEIFEERAGGCGEYARLLEERFVDDLLELESRCEDMVMCIGDWKRREILDVMDDEEREILKEFKNTVETI